MGHPPCKSHLPKEKVCADGFVQKPYCSGRYGCPMCGTSDTKLLPHCLTDSIPAHLSTDDGKPLFASAALDGRGEK